MCQVDFQSLHMPASLPAAHTCVTGYMPYQDSILNHCFITQSSRQIVSTIFSKMRLYTVLETIWLRRPPRSSCSRRKQDCCDNWFCLINCASLVMSVSFSLHATQDFQCVSEFRSWGRLKLNKVKLESLIFMKSVKKGAADPQARMLCTKPSFPHTSCNFCFTILLLLSLQL